MSTHTCLTILHSKSGPYDPTPWPSRIWEGPILAHLQLGQNTLNKWTLSTHTCLTTLHSKSGPYERTSWPSRIQEGPILAHLQLGQNILKKSAQNLVPWPNRNNYAEPIHTRNIHLHIHASKHWVPNLVLMILPHNPLGFERVLF